MENAIVIINGEDIAAAEKLARTLPAYKVFTFDPVLVDRIAMSELNNVELITWDNCPLYADIEGWARATAFQLEQELDLAVREIIPEVSIGSWQHLNWYFMLLALRWYSGLWNALGSKLNGFKLHVLVCDNPAAFYFNSFIPSLLLMQYLRTYGIEFSAYSYGEKPEDSHLVPDLRGTCSDAHAGAILGHVPTCMYDISYFNEEIKASGKALINLESKRFDMPVFSSKSKGLTEVQNAMAELPATVTRRIDNFSAQVTQKLDRLLETYIQTPDYRRRQTRHLADSYTSQLVVYYQLQQHFQRSKPSKILLSDHDVGLHGPIISFAKSNHLPVLLIPHSKTTFDLEFDHPDIAVCTHPIQGTEIANANGKRVVNFKLSYPENLVGTTRFPAPIKSIALLLNSISLNGIYFTRYALYLQGIKLIVQWCKANDIALKIRCKPAYTIVNHLMSEAGCDANMLVDCANMTMAEFVNSGDLCLMYDSPTSGAIEFLSRSIPIVNPIPKALTRMESMVANLRSFREKASTIPCADSMLSRQTR